MADKISNATAITPSVSNTPPRMLAAGDSGADVVALQNRLAALGFNPGTVDGKMGDHTVAALKKFQASMGLEDDGVVGSRTRIAMAPAPTPAPAVVKQAVDAVGISVKATASANTEVKNHPMGEEAAKVASPKSRADEQMAGAQKILTSLGRSAQVLAIELNPLFAPAALGIALSANARAAYRWEHEVPQQTMDDLMADEGAKAEKLILNLPNVYAKAGLAGLNSIADAGMTLAGMAADGAVAVYNSAASGVSYAYHGTVDGAAYVYNGAANLTNQAYSTAVDYGTAAATTVADASVTAGQGIVKASKWYWHFETAPLRMLGRAMAAVGSFFSGIGK